MSNYVPSNNAPKKHRILSKRETELNHHLKHQSSLETLQRHAEQTRLAQLSLAKALLSAKQAARSEDEKASDAERTNLLARLDLWNQMSADEVILYYRNRLQL